mmetsp:Transcript_105504/g.198661  ORF Transcript_105504/g.198661 Transcript_105504/m.198661 type:complete len:692 (-) Transcript_105504:73-2148(-)
METAPPRAQLSTPPGPPRPFAPQVQAPPKSPVTSECAWMDNVSNNPSPPKSESWTASYGRQSRASRSSKRAASVQNAADKHLSGVISNADDLQKYLSMPLSIPSGRGTGRMSQSEDMDDVCMVEPITSSAQVGAAFWASELPHMSSKADHGPGDKRASQVEREKRWKDKLHKVLEASSFSLLVIFGYLGLLFVFEAKQFIPYDSFFAIAVLWAGSMAGGTIAKLVGLPQLLGMLCSGIIIKNCGDLSRGLPDSWAATIRAFGLMNILIRGGLEMDVGAVRRVGMAVVRLTVLPGVSEAFAVAGLACPIIGCPFWLALATGFIIAAVSPAVVVGGMFNLQAHGYGVQKGIPSLVVAAASFDDVVAISGFSMFIGLAIGEGNVLLEALHGPINIVAGLGCGLLGAFILAATKLWDVRWKRSLALLLLGVIFTFSSKLAHFAGAGALASLVMAATAAQLWMRGFPHAVSQGPDDHAAHDTEADMCKVWKMAAEPLLFSVIGSALNFSKIDAATIPKAIGIVTGGVCVRTLAALFATYGAGLSWKERAFIALAWMPKATVQAALGSVPLDMARKAFEKDPEKLEEYEAWGVAILTTAVFSILLTAPAGLIVIQKLGPNWLEKWDGEEIEEGMNDKALPEESEDDQMDSANCCSVVPGAPHDSTEVAVLNHQATDTSVQVVEIDGADLAAGAGAGM